MCIDSRWRAETDLGEELNVVVERDDSDQEDGPHFSVLGYCGQRALFRSREDMTEIEARAFCQGLEAGYTHLPGATSAASIKFPE